MYFHVNWNYVRRFCEELQPIYRPPKKRYSPTIRRRTSRERHANERRWMLSFRVRLS